MGFASGLFQQSMLKSSKSLKEKGYLLSIHESGVKALARAS